MTDLPKKELLRPDEVAYYLDVSRSTVYLWIDHGLLTAEQYAPGGTIRVPRDAVENLRLRCKKDLE
ncbi:MAG: helix-turn-helix domain-containing protein [Syntrophales bacterium]|jgi:excisionase family DNA binding protein|nr:helix-turn-helix domain-containing protein [Syntrophales bacterium]MCK9527207.1 helix-turn-helix domain-containing protein [Syntrophales bacterium]MDX9921323.1 helix-turn-helix domain-containing protein [Syntrophales bacterium]